MIAEEGKPEYVIPTEDEARAVQLLRSLMAELSESAKASVIRFSGEQSGNGSRLGSALHSGAELGPGSSLTPGAGFSLGSDLGAALDSLRSVVRESFLPVGASAAPSVQTVQAPVNIQVTSHAAAPEAVARSIYDTAQRSLLKTLKGVFV